jgi:1-acyl-sn-glycerol-3-phosphate acyltransferase
MTNISSESTPEIGRGQKLLVGLNRLTPELKPPIITGIENLERVIHEGKPVIVVSTHRTESDIALAIRVIGGQLPLVITDQSTHESPKGDAVTHYGQKIIGGDNFLPISYHWENGQKKPDPFNPNDFTTIANVMQETGKSMLMAAHNPKQDNPEPGYGAAYLAFLSGAEILPVAIRLGEKKNLFRRRPTEVSIGKPLSVSSDNLHEFESIMAKRGRGEKLSPDDIDNYKKFVGELRQAGDQIFKTVDDLLPTRQDTAE